MKLMRRIARLEVRHRPPAAYPVYAVFAHDARVERIAMSDGSRLTDREAIAAYRELARSIALKVYVAFDPDIALHDPSTPNPPRRANNEPQEQA